MPSDYYDDGPPAEQSEMPAKKDPMEKKDPDDNGKTALIPTSLCPGLEVGDDIALKVVGVMQDEYQVRYSHDENSEDEKQPHEEPSMARASETNESPMGRYMED